MAGAQYASDLPTPVPAWMTAMARVGAASPPSSSTLPSVAVLKVRATCSAISRCPARLRNMKLRPLHDRVIVKRLEKKPRPPRASSSPTTPPKSPTRAKCWPSARASATTRAKVALNVKVGDRVLFGKYSGQTVKVDGDELLVMKEEDLFAVVEK
jgi:chaperonin GroES